MSFIITRKKTVTETIEVCPGSSFNPNFDGNLIALYDGDKNLSTVDWKDQSGNGYHLTLNNSPSIISNAINGHNALRLDGINQSGRRTSTPNLTQPTTIYSVLKQLSWTSSSTVFDGTTVSNRNSLHQVGSSPDLRSYAGSFLGIIAPAINDYAIITTLFNGVNSELRLNLNSANVGNANTQGLQGLSIGANYLNAGFINCEFAYIIIRGGADSTATQNIIINALKSRFAL